MAATDPMFQAFFEALYQRHTQDLTFQELRRSLTALSRIYTAKRDRLKEGAALDGRGKRAAFSLFYGPLHYLVIRHAVEVLGLSAPKASGPIVDLGCGTGVASCAWASTLSASPNIMGLDVSSWALEEARANWRFFRLQAQAKVARVGPQSVAAYPRAYGFVLAYVVNELTDDERARLLVALLAAHARGSRVLVVEPIARALTPWWPVWERAFLAAGGRHEPLRLRPKLPEKMALLSRAAGLDHRELTARCLSLSPSIEQREPHGPH